jgi:hypothetical protein
MTESLDALVARYGSPHLWTPWERFINYWRLFAEHVEIRVFIDVALRSPDKKLAQLSREKFGSMISIEHLDATWPGRGDFDYDWEGLTRVREAKEQLDGG